MNTPTITEFLLGRIAEDEAATNTASTPLYRQMFNGWHRGEVGGAFIGFTDRFTPDRVLAECAAKRRIVEIASAGVAAVNEGRPHGSFLSGRVHDSANILAALALPYADHPDYRQEWKP